MKSQSEKNEVGVELKYCEHCGGLWVRERGAGVYCDNCQPKVADLPAAKESGQAQLAGASADGGGRLQIRSRVEDS